MSFSLSEFKPTILFLLKFIGLYLVLNLCYGLYVSSYEPLPDPVTRWVTEQTAFILDILEHPTTVVDNPKKPTTALRYEDRAIVSVYEGCNGINVAIIFISFLFAFGPYTSALIWFIPIGLMLIHLTNLVRIGGLFLITLYHPHWLYFTHKYLFTAFIYVFVFLLWFWWVRRFTPQRS